MVKVMYEYVYCGCEHVEPDELLYNEACLHLRIGEWATCPKCKLKRQVAQVFITYLTLLTREG